MTAISDYLEQKVLTDYLGSGATSVIALYNVDPGDAGTSGTEVNGGTYSRKPSTWNVANGTATLAADVVWTGMPAATINGIGVFDGSGNLLFHGPLQASKTVTAGDAFAFPAGNLTITLD